MHETPEQWINRMFTIAGCRGLATRIAEQAFQAGRVSALTNERTIDDGMSFEEWMTNGESPSNN